MHFERSFSGAQGTARPRRGRVTSNGARDQRFIATTRRSAASLEVRIPVSWSQISAARVIVETDFADLEVEPSQGSPFFHNLTSLGIAYLCVARRSAEAFIDWAWLDAQPALHEAVGGAVRHIRLAVPLRVVVDTAKGRGTIAAPSAREASS